MARFALEPGETEIHHELATCVRDDAPPRRAALMLTERRIVCVMRRDATGFAGKLAAHFSPERHIVEIRRDDFAHLEVDETDGLANRTQLAFHARTAPAIRMVVVASSGDTWKQRIERWSKGDDLPTVALPRADVRR